MRKTGRTLVRLILVAAVLGVCAVLAAMGYTRWHHKSMTTFLGEQIIAIVNDQLVPDISFETLTYTPPWSISLKGAALTAPDGTEVITVKRLDITLAETPSLSKAILIKDVTFVEPSLLLISEEDGGIRGLDPFVRPGRETSMGNQEKTKDISGTSTNLSDVLRLERITMTAGSVVYYEREGAEPWVFDDLTTTLDINEDPQAPGWYAFDLVTGHEPSLEIESSGQFNLDTLILELAKLSTKLTINEETIPDLPPQLKTICRDHTIHGMLTGEASGRLVLESIEKSKFEAQLKLSDTNISFGEFQIPTEVVAADLYYDNGMFSLRSSEARLLGGEMQFALGFEKTKVTGDNAGENGESPAAGDGVENEAGGGAGNGAGNGAENRMAGRVILNEIELEQLLRQPGTEEKPSKLAGKLSGILNLRTTKASWEDREEILRSVEGDGTLQLREGRLWQIPFFSSMADLLNISSVLTPGSKGNARGDVAFTLDDDAVTVTKAQISNSLYAADGKGTIEYDGKIKGRMNAGVIEKINRSLGPLGKVFSALTDPLVKYTIGGTLSKPKFGTRVLGIGG